MARGSVHAAAPPPHLPAHAGTGAMTHYDVFNGDADGMCALHQLRLAAPRDCRCSSPAPSATSRCSRGCGAREATASRCSTSRSTSTATALDALLARGVRVTVVRSPLRRRRARAPATRRQRSTPAPDVCTAMLVDRHLGGRCRRVGGRRGLRRQPARERRARSGGASGSPTPRPARCGVSARRSPTPPAGSAKRTSSSARRSLRDPAPLRRSVPLPARRAGRRDAARRRGATISRRRGRSRRQSRARGPGSTSCRMRRGAGAWRACSPTSSRNVHPRVRTSILTPGERGG